MDLNVYIIKFTAIMDSLIAKHALSDLYRVGCLLDGLQPDLRSHVLTFCAKKSWRLSAHDTGTQEPDFGELKEFVLTEARPPKNKLSTTPKGPSKRGVISNLTVSPQFLLPPQFLQL